MTARILVGPAASGKTQACIERVMQVLSTNPIGPIWVVVPDRYQSYAFRRRLGTVGGAIGVHVGTFGHLYNEILWEAGVAIPVAPAPVIHRLIRASVGVIQSNHELDHYAPIAAMPGFLHELRSIISELKLAQVLPDDFLNMAVGYSPTVVEIARIYSEYQSKLEEISWADPEGVNWLATEALENDSTLFSNLPLLVVDGFDSFEGAQRAALRWLSQRVHELVITLPGTERMERSAHRRFANTLTKLSQEMHVRLEGLPPVPRLPLPIAQVEQSLFESKNRPAPANGHLTMLEVRGPREEAREVVRWMKARIIHDGLNPLACAIVAPDPERYRPLLREAGREFGVPLRFTHGESLTSSPAVTALLDLLDLPQRGFPSKLTIEVLRSPFFDLSSHGISPEDVNLLENASRHGLVIEGLEQWEEALTKLSQVQPEQLEQEGEDTSWARLPIGQKATDLLEGLRSFHSQITPPIQLSMLDWVSWLEDLMEALHFLEVEKTENEEAALVELREVLRALVLGEEIVEGKAINAGAFQVTLRSFLEGTYYQERRNPTDAAVLVLRVFEARGLRYRAVALMGLAEGLFPEVEREDPFLSEGAREMLGLDGRLGREQGGIFYQIMTRADDQLLITRPYLAEDGEYWEASPYWLEVANQISADPIILRQESPRDLSEACSAAELLFWGVRRKGLPPSLVEEFESRWEYLRHARDVLQARTGKTPEGPYEGKTDGISTIMNHQYGPDHVWSPSRLETYGECPYRFYIESVIGLELKVLPKWGIDVLQLGSMLHEALEMAYSRSADPTDVGQLRDQLDQVIEEIFSEAPEIYGFRPTHLWEVESKQLANALRETLNNLEALDSGWIPLAFEQPFGLQGAPRLELQVGKEKIQLRGVIDRLDRNEDGELRVIDYKTGSLHQGTRDLNEGRRLQLPIYALAAEAALGYGTPKEGFYWAILKGEPGQLRLSKFQPRRDEPGERGPSAAIAVMRKHVGEYVSAIREGKFPPVPPSGGCPEYCAAAGWCWRYRASGW